MRHEILIISITLVATLAGCGVRRHESTTLDASSQPATADQLDTDARPEIVSIHPPKTKAGFPFHLQPDGSSAISIETKNARKGMYLLFDGQPVRTNVASDTIVTAAFGKELIDRPGTHELVLTDGRSKSKPIAFVVE